MKRECNITGMPLLILIASLILIVAVSLEIITGDNLHFTPCYMRLQFVICIIFLVDLVIRGVKARHKGRFWLYNLPYLLLAIPWLNIVAWCGCSGGRSLTMAIASIPVWRSFLALYVVVHWLTRGHRARKLFAAYGLTVICITYLCALLFYDYEILTNPHVKNFGNALWWAWMNVTTVGAPFFPITTAGKIICVMLPILGMAMFPIFTVYITTLYSATKEGEK